jgi:hypothetical protein
MRKPIVVAVANAVLPGLGYILLGRRRAFGWLLLIGVALQIIQLCIDPIPPYFIVYGSTPVSVTLGAAALFLVLLAFAYDGYQLAKER